VNEHRAPCSNLAVSVAALFVAACQQKSATDAPAMKIAKATGDNVHCLGIHECKGKGWIDVPRAECSARGGQVLEG
jgi:hypothetical protein